MSLLDLLPGPFPTTVMVGLMLQSSIRRSTNVTFLGYLLLLLHFDPDKLQQQRSAFTLALGCANGSSQLTQL